MNRASRNTRRFLPLSALLMATLLPAGCEQDARTASPWTWPLQPGARTLTSLDGGGFDCPVEIAVLADDPLAVQIWSHHGDENLCFIGFRPSDTRDVNRLIAILSDIPSPDLKVALGMPSEAMPLPGPAARCPVLLSMPMDQPSLERFAACLWIDPADAIVDLDALQVPAHIAILAGDTVGDADVPTEDVASQVAYVVAAHARSYATARPIPPALSIPCPDWAKAPAPPRVQPYVGRFGMPDRFLDRHTGPIAPTVRGIDYWQANHFIVCREETETFLYEDYTPLDSQYIAGSLPDYEAIVAECTDGMTSRREKAVALLTQVMPAIIRHPEMPPFGRACRPDRGTDDTDLLKSGKAWCNEQARIFVRLCQVAGIPARLIFLWYQDTSGHVVTEFYCEDGWCMADASWYCVFPGPDGALLSARECHGSHRSPADRLYAKRIRDVLAVDDETLVGGRFVHLPDGALKRELIRQTAVATREKFGAMADDAGAGKGLWRFGVVNYPPPPASAATFP